MKAVRETAWNAICALLRIQPIARLHGLRS